MMSPTSDFFAPQQCDPHLWLQQHVALIGGRAT